MFVKLFNIHPLLIKKVYSTTYLFVLDGLSIAGVDKMQQVVWCSPQNKKTSGSQ